MLTALRKASQGKRKSSPPIFKRGDDGHWYRTENGRAYRISELRLKAGENLPRPPKVKLSYNLQNEILLYLVIT